MGALQCQ